MKAIVIAAGQGSRLRPYTDDRPKCMVPVGGKPILHHQLEAFRAAGIRDIVVVRGYKGRRIRPPAGMRGVRFVDNVDYPNNNILESLFCAGAELVGDCVVSYGDIVYHPAVVTGLVEAFTPATLIVDRAWQKTYAGRTDHPVEQAELCEISSYGLVSRVGKQVGPETAVGEFIGLARFDSAVVARLWARYLRARSRGPQTAFGNAPTLRKAYLTDLLNDAIDAGEPIAPLGIDGHWREIDTVQDLERAADAITW
jgi:choline kinase